MKHIVSSLPLLLTAAGIAAAAIVTVLNLKVVSPETIGLGAAIIACAGLCAMAGTDSPSRGYR